MFGEGLRQAEVWSVEMFFLPHKKVYPQGTGMLLPGHCPTLYCRLTIISAGFPSRPPSLLASTESHLVKSSATQSSYQVTPIRCLSVYWMDMITPSYSAHSGRAEWPLHIIELVTACWPKGRVALIPGDVCLVNWEAEGKERQSQWLLNS